MPPQHAARRRARNLGSDSPVAFTSWRGALWTVVVALDFYWLSNPVVFDPFNESLRNACIATGAGVLLTLPRLRVPRPSWAVLAVLAYGYASAIWSQAPSGTVGFTSVYLLIALLATVVATNADARSIVQGILLGGVAVIAVSYYAFRDELPRATVPLDTIGSLAGIGGNRNTLSYTMVLALAFAVSFLPRLWWARAAWAIGTGAILVGIYAAQSSTGFLATLVVAVVAAALALNDRFRRPAVVRSARRRWGTRGIGLLVLVGGVALADFLSRLTGRDTSTLSGRVPLWEAVWASTTGVSRWFGDGWGAVWPHGWHPADDNPAYQGIIDRIGIRLYHGHSSFFDLLPEIGLVGFAVYMLTYVQSVRRALTLRDPHRPPLPAHLQASRSILLGVLGLLMVGITEPMSTIPLGWFLITVLATRPDSDRADGRRGQTGAPQRRIHGLAGAARFATARPGSSSLTTL